MDLPQCGTGLSCISFELEGTTQARCVDGATVCTDLLECGGGTECVVLESYPAQLTCSGQCTGSRCDDSVGSPG